MPCSCTREEEVSAAHAEDAHQPQASFEAREPSPKPIATSVTRWFTSQGTIASRGADLRRTLPAQCAVRYAPASRTSGIPSARVLVRPWPALRGTLRRWVREPS